LCCGQALQYVQDKSAGREFSGCFLLRVAAEFCCLRQSSVVFSEFHLSRLARTKALKMKKKSGGGRLPIWQNYRQRSPPG